MVPTPFKRVCSMAAVLTLGTLAQADSPQLYDSDTLAAKFVAEYCVNCHGPDKQKSDVRLDTLGFDFQDEDVAWQWLDAIDMLTIGDMPPKGEPQPSADAVDALTTWLNQRMQSVHQSPGESATPRLRRMNGYEYLYTLRDLLGLNIDSFNPTASFPQDERHHGFNNLGEHLILSNYLLEQYLHAASESIEKVSDISANPQPFEVTFKPNDIQVTFGTPGDQNAHLENPYYHHKAFDYYMVNVGGEFIDMGHGDGKLQRLHNPEFKGVPATGYYDITVRAEAVGRINPYDSEILGVDPEEPIQMRILANDPRVGDTAYGYNISNRILADFDLKDNKPKNYKVRVWLDEGYTVALRYPNGPQKFIAEGRKILDRYHPETKVSNYRDEFSLEAPPGEIPEKWFSEVYQGPRIRFYSLKIERASVRRWPPTNYQTLFQTRRHEIDPAKAPQIIRSFAQKAFRRPLIPGETDRYESLYNQLNTRDGNPREALKGALSAILSSPDFLYIQSNPETLSGDESSDVDAEQYALASRLSYFLWSSMPDQKLLTAARRGVLHREDVIRQQTKRMLKDPKSDAFARHFTDTWLELHKLGTAPPDAKKFKSYSVRNLEPQMRQETQLFFQYILDKNRDVSEFIDSDYTFLTEDLAKHYRIPDVEGREFRRVTLPEGSIRGGLMGHASILTATANGIETSPVIRGVWVMENILGTPPSPPPLNVEPIEPDTRGAATIRERLIKHQNVASCAECHVKIDPPGFALEAFNPVGEFRQFYEDDKGKDTQEIDTFVTLHSGESVADLRELRSILKETRKDQFVLGLSRKMLTYALGRELLLSDRPSLDHIVDQTISKGYGFRDLILETVSSDAFRQSSADAR
ncbi:MAG: DUF1592 domain-containing protein [Synoicihabitans sp.]